MAYKNSKWQLVSSKQNVNKKKGIKTTKIVGRKFHYIWKTKSTWARIVFYEWVILSHNEESWLVMTRYLDRNIKINPDGKTVDRELPLRVLTLD